MPPIPRDQLPTVTRWARRHCDGTNDQVDVFLATLDRDWLDALDAALHQLGRDLRAWLREIPLDDL